MHAQQILQADLLDILFEHRNKTYGAYELRRYYQQRLKKALMMMLGLVIVLTISASIGGKEVGKATTLAISDTLKLVDVTIDPPPSTPPPPAAAPPPPMAMTANLPPVIVPDELVTEPEVPEVEVLENTLIGTTNRDGLPDEGITQPVLPEERGTGAAIVPIQESDNQKIWTKVEIPAEFPGGVEAWIRYLERNLRVPDAAIDNGTQGLVQVQFVVDEEGNISDVEALNDPGDGLAEEAMRIIRKGPKWKPAEQNGQKVKYRHVQRISFRLE